MLSTSAQNAPLIAEIYPTSEVGDETRLPSEEATVTKAQIHRAVLSKPFFFWPTDLFNDHFFQNLRKSVKASQNSDFGRMSLSAKNLHLDNKRLHNASPVSFSKPLSSFITKISNSNEFSLFRKELTISEHYFSLKRRDFREIRMPTETLGNVQIVKRRR